MATGLFNLKQVNQAISQGAWSGYIAPKWVEYLVVAGGGGGAFAPYNEGGMGGGGAGGLLTGIVTVAAGTSYTVTVGSGGAGSTTYGDGNNGVASVFGAISTTGGGGGAGTYGAGGGSGAAGGSGGGNNYGFANPKGGASVANQGNYGGAGARSYSSNNGGGGGGGAGTSGLNGTTIGGNGGAGIASAISGTVTTYAGGGGGGGSASGGGFGGVGGGGGGTSSTNNAAGAGTANTGGGGGGNGGGGSAPGGAGGSGGSGIVVVRYPGNVQFFTGGTVNYNNGYIIHIFTSSGTLAPTTPTVYNTSYQISRSLRFNSADSAYLNRTPASATNRKTWTFSAWVKRSALGTDYEVFSAGTASPYMQIFFRSATGGTADTLSVSLNASSVILTTTQVFRDVSAWYHIVAAVDTTQATSSDRIKLYVNGSQVTAFNTANYPSQNYDTNVNNTQTHAIGGFTDGTSTFSGYMTEINFVDGQALTPSSFGATSTTNGVWAPIQYTGTYGTNGFYLNFSDNSNTTAATLGKDYSGNGNNWTPNNFSVTAGAGNDSLVDSPTAYGFDTGVGGTVRGNYATLNPLSLGGGTLTNGNLDLINTTAGALSRVSTIGVSSGKWYCECTITAVSSGSNYLIVGVSTITEIATFIGSQSTGYGYFSNNGYKYNNNSATAYGASFVTNDIIGIALDLDAGTLTFYKNGVSQGVAFSSLPSGTWYFGASCISSSSATYNFGQRAFAYTAPSGYQALCTQNLPTPTIGATSTTLATKYFNPVLYTGTGATQTISTVGFSPGLMVLKDRTNGSSYVTWQDQLRGASVRLFSSLTNAESTDTNGVSAFTSTGFSLGTNGNENLNAGSFVAWSWLANTSGSTNTAGSITSTVSANTTSGFSVVTYTGNGTQPSTIGHGLSVAPSFIIVKTRNSASYDWNCYHISLGNTQYIALNTTAAASSAVSLWNNTTPTSTVFTVNHAAVNTSSNTYVAYCFAAIAGYSAFGSYTGNGSADGAFVYTGFRPAFIMVKASSGTSAALANWLILDTTRNTYNEANNKLAPNLTDAENGGSIGTSSQNNYDLLSNGFKARTTNGSSNESGTTYIFMALAQNPFKYSLAR